jgi:hypothetical protein
MDGPSIIVDSMAILGEIDHNSLTKLRVDA